MQKKFLYVTRVILRTFMICWGEMTNGAECNYKDAIARPLLRMTYNYGPHARKI